MIAYIQWAKAVPESWEQFDVTSNAQVRRFARKAEPNANSVLDQAAGWVAAANVQGVTVCGWDHVGVEFFTNPARLVVSCWNDDPDDWPVGQRHGAVWTFQNPAPDFNLPGDLRGAINTVQTFTAYSDPGGMFTTVHNCLPYSQFPFPDSRNVFHGIWMTNEKWAAHVALQTLHGWREWIV